jgi:hypothetical protein
VSFGRVFTTTPSGVPFTGIPDDPNPTPALAPTRHIASMTYAAITSRNGCGGGGHDHRGCDDIAGSSLVRAAVCLRHSQRESVSVFYGEARGRSKIFGMHFLRIPFSPSFISNSVTSQGVSAARRAENRASPVRLPDSSVLSQLSPNLPICLLFKRISGS